MLRGQIGRQWKGTYDLHFDHHDSITALKTSYDTGCSICRALFEQVIASVRKDLGIDLGNDERHAPEKLAIDWAGTILSANSTASLAIIDEIEDDDVFRLDFKLEWVVKGKPPSAAKRTFILKQIGKRGSPIICFEIETLTTKNSQSSRNIFNSHVRGNILK